jgi:hypothetical protein
MRVATESYNGAPPDRSLKQQVKQLPQEVLHERCDIFDFFASLTRVEVKRISGYFSIASVREAYPDFVLKVKGTVK